MQLNEQEIVRRKKLKDLKALGIDPYPADTYEVTNTAKEILFNFNEDTIEDYKKVCIAGRLVSIIDMGKVNFAYVQDSTDKIQISLKMFLSPLL